MKLIITSKLNLFLVLIATSVLFLGLTADSFADTPTQNTATVTFDVNSGQAEMTWDFGTHTERDYCLVKTDFHLIPDNIIPADAVDADIVGKVFLGDHTTSLYDQGGMTYQSLLANPAQVTEATIPCIGSMTFNIPSGYHYDDIQLFMTFAEIIEDDSHDGSYKLLDTVDHDFGIYNINTLHEITVQYTNYIAFEPLQCSGDNRWEKGTEYFKDINTPDTIVTLDTRDVCTISNVGGSTDTDGTITEDETTENGAFPTTGDYYLVYPTTTVSSSGGGSSNEHKTRPTFGVDHNTSAQLVDAGLVINGKSFTVDDNFWTAIPMQQLTVGDVQNFTATTYAPKTLKVMEFLFGIPEVGDWGKAEASVEVYLDYRGDIIEVIAENAEDVIIDIDSINATASISKCKVTSNTPTCNTVSIEVIFNEAPVGKVMALQAIDYKGRTNILYFNDGLELDGDSTNPPTLMEITSPLKYKGLQTVQRIDKVLDTWMTLDMEEPVLVYQMNSFGTFIPIDWRTFEKISDAPTGVMDRYHSDFGEMKQYEQTRAEYVFIENYIK